MAFIGRMGPTSPQVRASRYDVNVGSTSVQTVGQTTLDDNERGYYVITCGYNPSQESGQYRNSDPDDWAARCYYNGNQLGDTFFGNEDAPRTYRMGSFASWSLHHTGGNANVETRWSKQYGDDPDGGGMRGFAYMSIHRLTEE
jgi:hypothetical protein